MWSFQNVDSQKGLSSAEFFQNKLFQRIPSALLSKWQAVWIQVRPDLDPNCLQRLSADDTGR